MTTEKSHWRVIEVTPDCVTVEDVDGPKDKQGKLPKVEFHGGSRGIGHFEIGDWIGLHIYLVNRPLPKELKKLAQREEGT